MLPSMLMGDVSRLSLCRQAWLNNHHLPGLSRQVQPDAVSTDTLGKPPRPPEPANSAAEQARSPDKLPVPSAARAGTALLVCMRKA